MTEVQKYKYLAAVLAATTLVFAYLYFTMPEPTVSDIYTDVSENVSACSEAITEWNEEYGDQASSTEKQAALDEILADCEREIGEESERLE